MPNIPRTTKYKWLRQYKDTSKSYSESKYAKLYNTTQWRRLRLIHLKDNPLCVMCKENNRVTAGKVVDHIKPVSEGGSFTDTKNLQTLCDKHHRIKSAKETNRRKKIKNKSD